MYPHIIYWKWNDEEWEGKFREGIEDIIRRSPFDLIYISLVWCKRRLLDDESLLKIKEAADILHKAGRGLMLDIDVRQERWEFARRYPHSLLGLVKTEVIELDSKGRGSVVSKCGGTGDHYGDYPVVDSRLLCALAFAGEDGWYRKDTLRDITSECRVVDRRPGEIKVDIDAGNAGKMRAWIAFLHYFEYPDLFSPHLLPFLEELLDKYRDVPLDGAAMDEFGFIPHPGYDFSSAWRSPWYSENMAKAYESFCGRNLLLDIFMNQFAPEGEAGEQVKAIEYYYEFIRGRVVEIENWFYEEVKRRWGREAFVGVHPTWFAIHKSDCACEIWKNGFDWWEAKRDFAQTDEICIYPIRAALAHKWDSPVWYNMWYSMGKLDVESFWEEAWENLRYGGRMHTLGYAAEREARNVLELKKAGFLESVAKIEERISYIDMVQEKAVKTYLLVVFGYPAAVNWLENGLEEGRWFMDRGVIHDAFALANALWEKGFLCDLVPSYEIDNGSLRREGGRLIYGEAEFDTLIFLYPQFSKRETLAFLKKFAESGGRLLLVGDCSMDFEGEDVGEDFARLKEKTFKYFDNMPSFEEIEKVLCEIGVERAPSKDGARLLDGSFVCAVRGRVPAGTPLRVDVQIDGVRIQAECEDLFLIRLSGGGRIEKLAAPALRMLEIDGKRVYEKGKGEDIVISGGEVLIGSFEEGSI